MKVTMDEMAHFLRIPELEQWQREFIPATEKNLVLNIGRKGGKSAAEIIKASLTMVNESVPGVSFSGGILMVSVGQRQAKELLMGVKTCLAGLGYEFTKERSKITENVAYCSTTEIQMFNNNRLLALPCGLTGDNIRPYSFHMGFFDEADSFHDDVFTSTDACFMAFDGQKILASTPYPDSSKNSHFYQMFFNKAGLPPSIWRKWWVRTADCKHADKTWLLHKKRGMLRPDYEREYEAKFTESADGVFPGALLAACTSDTPLDKFNLYKKGPTMIGVDYARFGEDDNAIAFATLIKDRLHVWVHVIHGRYRLTHINGKIVDYFRKFNGRKVVTDEAGLGGGPTDYLIRDLGKNRVLGIVNAKRTDDAEGRNKKYQKVDLYSNLRCAMEWGRIVLDTDIEIRRSLRSVRYTYGKNNVLSIYGYDDHIAEAIVRAVHPFLSRRKNKITIENIPKSFNLDENIV